MSYESNVCRTFLDINEVTKTQVISAILSQKDADNLSTAQVESIVRVVSQAFDNSVNVGLGVMQRAASTNVGQNLNATEVEGKKQPKASKSEAA